MMATMAQLWFVFRFLTALELTVLAGGTMSDASDLLTYVIVATIISGVAMWLSLRARNRTE
jgi:hypothetical protein